MPNGFIYQDKPEPVVSLTAGERTWLKAHRDIRFVFSDNYPPILIVGADGSLSGIMKDMLDLLNQRLGTDFAITTTSTKSLIEMVMTKKVAGQLVLTAGNGANRRLLETHNVLTSYPVVYARAGEPIRLDTLKDLEGKTVAILGGAYYAENALEPFQNRINIVKTGTILEALKMLFEGKVDFMIGVSQHTYHIAANQFLGLVPVFVMTDRPINGVMGVRDDWPELVGIINKGLQSITEDERNAIYAKWVQLPQQKEVIEPTAEEKDWLAQNHTVRVRLSEHAPYLYSKDGKPLGITVDLINAVSERTGIKFQFAKTSPPFSVDLKGLIQHEGPDLIASLNPTPEREKLILFTKPYVSTPRFIFTRDDAEFVASMENLSGKTVAVIKNYLAHKELAKNYPDINLLFCKNNEDALRAVSSGKAFAFIGGLLSTPIMISKFGLNNLKASAPSSLSGGTVAMGIRSDWPELRDIINKVFDSIPESEKTAIINKWSSVKIDYGIRPADVLKWVLVVAGGASGILFLFMFWNRSLKKQVQERTGELERSNESLEGEISERKNAQDELRRSRDYLKNLTDSMGDAIFSVSRPGRKIDWANDSFKVLGYEPGEYVGRTTEFLFPNRNDFLAFGDKTARAIEEGKRIVHIEQPLRKKSGEIFPANITLTFFRTKKRVVSITAVARDITARKQMEQAVKESEERYRGLSEAAFEAIFISEKGVCLEQNSTAEKMFGYTLSEAIGRKATEWIAPEDREMVMNNMLFGYEEPYEVTALRKNGSTFAAEIQGRMMHYRERAVRVTALSDITGRKEVERSLRESREKAEMLGMKLLSSQEAERARLARELHDDITQRLAFLNIEVDKLEMRNEILPEPVRETLRQIGRDIGELSSDIQMISRRLHPTTLGILGLARSIETECKNFTRLKEIPVTLDLDDTLQNLSKEVSLCTYRILQEGMRNIVRHSKATDVHVTLFKKNDVLHLMIKDNGIGFDFASNTKNEGLRIASMTERARLIQGDLTIESRPGKGTVIKLAVPLKTRNEV